MKIIRIDTMRKLEQQAIASGVPGYELMRRAGEGAAREIRAFARGREFGRAVVLAGRGNNGGDALVVAARLGLPVIIYATGPLNELRGEAAEAARDLPENIEVRVCDGLTGRDFRRNDLIIDGLLGTGFTGELRPRFRNWIETANRSGCPIAALDLPSGINGDTGKADSGLAIRAELTVTFGCPKCGLFRADGPAASGRLRLVDIGVPEPEESEGEAFFAADAEELLHRPAYDTYKNLRGRLLIAAGSSDYSGAAVLCSRAALRAGAGIVRLATPVRPYAALPGALIVREVDTAAGSFDKESIPALAEMMQQSDAVAAGSGWSQCRGSAAVLSALQEFPGPLLLDADALNTAAREPQRWLRHGKTVITPHPGEAKRLAEAFGVPQFEDRTNFALALAAKLDAVTVLKGPHTVVADPSGRWSLNTSGCAALATAGSGDVLAGIIGALLAGNPEHPFEMAKLGAFLHGLAGETGKAGLIADDLPEFAAEAKARLTR